MVVTLDRNELFRLNRARGATLEALDAAVWVTEAGLPGDVCLAPGMRYRVRGDGLVLVGTDGGRNGAATHLAVRPAAGEAPAGLLRRLGFRRLDGWRI